jgi:predicted MPP superfamily phosphohydrolase
MKQILVISFIVLSFLGLNYYAFFRLWNLVPVGKSIVIWVGIALILCFFLGFLGGYFLPTSLTIITYKIGMAFFIIVLYLVLIFLILDMLRLVLPMKQILLNNWTTFIVLTIVLTSFFTYGYINYRNIKRVELTVSIDKEILPLKIVAISDLHLGYGIGKRELDKWIELINRENPDIVLMAGDIIDNHAKSVMEREFAESLKKINSRYGVFACLGNHEYIAGLSHSLEFLKYANIKVLRDTAILVNNEFYLIGRDDRMIQNRKSLLELTQSLDQTKPFILLDHQPFHLSETEEIGIDLQISGHTHLGQLQPISWLTHRLFEIAHGHLQKGNSHIYVSSGIGIWGGKFRIGTQSEYVVINLKHRNE